MAASNSDARLRRLERLAHWLDEAFTVPGLGWRFGLDPLLGLVPVVGDLVTTALGFLWIAGAWRAGAPPSLLFQMVGNVAIEGVAGAIPVVGDLFDFAWKAQSRNLALFRAYLDRPVPTVRESRRWAWLTLGFLAFAGLGLASVVALLGFALWRLVLSL